MSTPQQHQKKILALLRSLPRLIANETLHFFDASFEKQGFEDTHLRKWKERNPQKGKRKKNSRRGILILTGDLRRSMKTKISPHTITIQSVLPYARIHNEGGMMRGGKRMPQRQFVGKSRNLDKRIHALIEKTLKKAEK